MCSLFCSPAVPPGLSVRECGASGLLAVALPAPFHNPPSHGVRQPLPCWESSLTRLPFSAPPTDLDEYFFFISLVVRVPYSSIFCQFWLFFVVKFVVVLLLVVRGGTVCLPMPPSWPEAQQMRTTFAFIKIYSYTSLCLHSVNPLKQTIYLINMLAATSVWTVLQA